MHTDDLPTSEPKQITLGETLEWTKSLKDFSAADWTLTYYFRGPATGFDVVATADDDDFSIIVLSTTTDDMSPGLYYWQAWVVDIATGTEKHKIAEGTVEVIKGLNAVPTNETYDGRSKFKKILDAIDAMLEGKASLDQQEYLIAAGGSQRQLKRLSILELLEARKVYAALVAEENRSKRTNAFGTIKVHIHPPSK